MCGVAGILRFRSVDRDSNIRLTREMSAAQKSRGPDQDGIWSDHRAGLGLVRLQIEAVSYTHLTLPTKA